LGGFSCVSCYIKLLCSLINCFNYPLTYTIQIRGAEKPIQKVKIEKMLLNVLFLADFFLIVLSCSYILKAEKYIG
jgi:hypothetical protein